MLRDQLRQFAELDLDLIFKEFYDTMLSNEDFSAFFENDAQIKSLVTRQKKFLLDSMVLDDALIKKRYVELGEMHHKINIPYVDYMAGMGILERGIARSIGKAGRLDLLDFSFSFFYQIRAFSAKGYLNEMIQDDIRDIDLYLDHVRKASEIDMLLATNRIMWLKEILLAIKLEDRNLAPSYDLPDEYSSAIALAAKEDSSFKNYTNDIAERMELNAANLFYFLDKGSYEEVLPLYRELMSIYKLTLILTNVVTIAATNRTMKGLTKDPITGLLTRQTYDSIMVRELAIAEAGYYEISFIMIDVDNFKEVNDNFGHAYGDQVLAAVAKVVRKVLRTTDFGFRFGGDEFLLLLKGASPELAVQQAELMRTQIEALQFISTDQEKISVTASFGVKSYSPPFLLSASAMVEEADKQLYAAKAAGRNRVI